VLIVADLAPIDAKLAKKIADIVRRLMSDQPGEVTTALEALGRVLQSAGTDAIHCVADRIEHHSGLTEAEMKTVFEAGVVKGLQRAKQQARVNGGIFPPAHDMAMWCRQQHDQPRNDWERTFINDIAARSLSRGLTPRQEEKLRSIFLRTGGLMV
jgi:hypothetical protein